jgi:hypothetical protein
MKPLTDYVCNKEQAEELKRLGVIQDSIFYWTYFEHRNDCVLATRKKGDYGYEYHFLESIRLEANDEPIYGKSAFTSGELRVALGLNGDDSLKTCAYHLLDVCEKFQNENEAEDAADILIRAIKAKTISIEIINKRLRGK